MLTPTTVRHNTDERYAWPTTILFYFEGSFQHEYTIIKKLGPTSFLGGGVNN